jgi:hypothetical protein
MRNASNDLTFDSVEPPVDISTTYLDLKCFKSAYKKSHLNPFNRDTQRRDFRLLEVKIN